MINIFVYVVEVFIILYSKAEYKYMSPFSSLLLVHRHFLFSIKFLYIGGFIHRHPHTSIKFPMKSPPPTPGGTPMLEVGFIGLYHMLDEKLSLNPRPDELTQHALSKLDNTHPAMCDNKAVHQVQPTVDHFMKMDFGQFKVATIKTRCLLAQGGCTFSQTQKNTNHGMEWNMTIDKFPRCNCPNFQRCTTPTLGRKGNTSFANTNICVLNCFTSQFH